MNEPWTLVNKYGKSLFNGRQCEYRIYGQYFTINISSFFWPAITIAYCSLDFIFPCSSVSRTFVARHETTRLAVIFFVTIFIGQRGKGKGVRVAPLPPHGSVTSSLRHEKRLLFRIRCSAQCFPLGQIKYPDPSQCMDIQTHILEITDWIYPYMTIITEDIGLHNRSTAVR